jgi:hypothetical protein
VAHVAAMKLWIETMVETALLVPDLYLVSMIILFSIHPVTSYAHHADQIIIDKRNLVSQRRSYLGV